MFDPSDHPRVFGLAPGVDFPAALVAGLRQKMAAQPPEAMARVELYLSTERMARRVRQLFDDGPATLLPQIRMVTDLADPITRAHLPQPVPPLRRRLELTDLVSRLLEQEPNLAPRAALFDLADSLATLMEEMHTEGVTPDAISGLDVSDQSGHWQRALKFLQIVQHYFGSDTAPDPQTYLRLALKQRLISWAGTPPTHPILVAGSTGSRGTTAELMRAVATLPQGAVILPGFDFDMPQPVWSQLTDALLSEDHPQFRFAKLLDDLELASTEVDSWTAMDAPDPDRNRLISLALRPAPVTHQWLTDGPKLPDLVSTTAQLTLLEVPSQREEALCIAMRLREAAETGTRAALITPDRMLTRQVTSALDQWGIKPDDSAGIPAQLTLPGRFLRHVSTLFQQDLTAEVLLTLLKHPLTHHGAERGQHLLNTRDLELYMRKQGWAFPQPEALCAWGAAHDRSDWAAWVATQFCGQMRGGQRPLGDWIAAHIDLAQAICAGAASDDYAELWNENAGRKVKETVTELQQEAGFGSDLAARDYADLFGAILSRAEVRDRDAVHPHILIWGTLEARVMGADLLILAGLNEGSWPEMPGADPWLNRKMRHDAGLLLPERRIGLSAHDFQQAAAAQEVWLTRATKSDDAETVPSRWLNRLTNLMNGLPGQNGPEAVQEMQARGQTWLAQARVLETPIFAAPEPRPSPVPPTEARPRRLSVTAIKRLIRDPYAIYARSVLHLRPLDLLQRAPDALLRGILVHSVLEAFIKETVSDPAKLDPDHLLKHARHIFGDPGILPFPTTRMLWQARMARVAEWFVDTETARLARATPMAHEIDGHADLPELGFTLTAKADRIDIDASNRLHIYDYKTGAAPSPDAQIHFDKQLLLEAAIAEQGGFKGLPAEPLSRAVYISLANQPREVPAPLEKAPPAQVWDEFRQLIAAYLVSDTGFTARRALLKDSDPSDYDHLARFGEWDVIDPAKKVFLA